jgi:heat shock protein HslJ
VLVLGSCQGRAGHDNQPAIITDRVWALRELDGLLLDTTARPPTLRLESEGTRASGYAGCNRMAGTYSMAGDTLMFGPLALTRMACPDMDIETRYTAALAAGRSYRVEDGQLVLLADGRVLARFAPAAADSAES